MFLNNKYSRTYHAITDAAKHRELTGYAERHHVVPKSMGGTEVVKLTAREHFICHCLLVKMTEGSNQMKMALAVTMMKCSSPDHSGKRYVNSRLYDHARKLVSESRRDPVLDATRRAKISKSKTGGIVPPRTPEWNRNLGLAGVGRTHTDEYKQMMAASKAAYWAAREGQPYATLTCPHCGKQGGGPNMSRYHFDKCKART